VIRLVSGDEHRCENPINTRYPGDHWYEDTQALEEQTGAAGCWSQNLKGIWLINLD